MKDIFSDLYKKVLGFFVKAEQSENVKDIARNRLRVVLMQDRTNLNPQLLERMRKELVELLSKYVEMDKEALELNFEQEGDQMALMLSIPVLRAKEESEIEETLVEEESKENDIKQEDENIAEDEASEETPESDDNTDEDINAEEDEAAEEKFDNDTEEKNPNKALKTKVIECPECGDCNECEVDDKIHCEFKKKRQKESKKSQ